MILRHKKHAIAIWVGFMLTACSPSELAPKEYVKWVDNPENGLSKEYVQGNLELTCQYTPNEYVILKQMEPDHIQKDQLKIELDALQDLYQFKLKFQNSESGNFLRDNYTSEEQFNTRSMYLSYDIRYDLTLVQNDDTTLCSMNHHERTYGNTPFETLLIAFPKTSSDATDLELIFNDRVFGLGRVKFFYEKDVLEDIPELDLQ